MAILRAQVVIPYVSNKPEDVVVNTWHFDAGLIGSDFNTPAYDQLVEFYNIVAGTGLTLASTMSNALSRVVNACKIKFYDLADPIPRPVDERSWTLGPSSSPTVTELPAEVALCGSFYAERNLPRRRGRIYLGPFHTLSAIDAASERSRPSVALVEQVRAGLGRMVAKPADGPKLAVYSRVDNVARRVTAGWVDDAWDTQRRRGQDAMARVLF